MNINTVFNCDCICGMRDNIQTERVHLIVTSPPYYNAKEYSHWNNYSEYLLWLEEVFTECYRVLKQGRMCCVNISVVIEPRAKRNEESKRLAIPFHFVNIMEKIGFKFLEDIIWVKPDGAVKNRNGRFSLDRQPMQYKPNVVNEYILVFQKPINGLIDKVLRNYSKEIKKQSLIEDGYERTNIWHINPETKVQHPAPYPEQLADKLIKYYSFVGDTVLDIFLGSGTTAKMALLNKRLFYAFEKDEYFYNMACKRINNINKS